MTSPDAKTQRRLDRFIAEIDANFRDYGEAQGLPAAMEKAVRETPRHRFVTRCVIDRGGFLRPLDPSAPQDLDAIYSDEILIHTDASGAPALSTNSQASYVLWLVHVLGVAPGDRVLEIGSGSGWLAAVMSRLVGDAGRVVGVEIIADLAEQSRRDFEALGLKNIAVYAADGMRGCPQEAPFDKTMITAATWDFPIALFAQVKDGGFVLAPIATDTFGGCLVALLKLESGIFRAMSYSPGSFVPLIDSGQTQRKLALNLRDLPFWPDIAERRAEAAINGARRSDANLFHNFLRKSEPGFTEFAQVPASEGRGAHFGVVDAGFKSVAVWMGDRILSYGGASAAERLSRAYAAFCAAGRPNDFDFDLDIVDASKMQGDVPTGVWREVRGASALLWRLRRDGRR